MLLIALRRFQSNMISYRQSLWMNCNGSWIILIPIKRFNSQVFQKRTWLTDNLWVSHSPSFPITHPKISIFIFLFPAHIFLAGSREVIHKIMMLYKSQFFVSLYRRYAFGSCSEKSLMRTPLIIRASYFHNPFLSFTFLLLTRGGFFSFPFNHRLEWCFMELFHFMISNAGCKLKSPKPFMFLWNLGSIRRLQAWSLVALIMVDCNALKLQK